MTATPPAPPRDTGATAPSIRWAVVERECRARGATTDDARAELLGIDRRTVIRWRHGQTSARLATVMQVARVLGVSLDALIGSEATA